MNCYNAFNETKYSKTEEMRMTDLELYRAMAEKLDGSIDYDVADKEKAKIAKKYNLCIGRVETIAVDCAESICECPEYYIDMSYDDLFNCYIGLVDECVSQWR
jgi:hypothetical protein